jgi:SAM-dependent methyltransferase
MRRFIKDLLKGGADVYELERRVAELDARSTELRGLELRMGVRIGEAEAHANAAGHGGPFRVEHKTIDERNFRGQRGNMLVEIRPEATYPQTRVRVTIKNRVLDELLEFAHLGLAKVLTEYDFQSVLDIGSGFGAAARCFRFVGKDLHTVEAVKDRTSDIEITGDYIHTPPLGPFDLVWASHILEHQRNVGAFLDKVFTDTKEGGLVAITVPSALSPMIIGHPSIFTPMHLIYHLVLAGFDCREARVKCYDWQFTVLVTKRSNGLPQGNIATTHYPLDAPAYHPDLLQWLPVAISESGDAWGEVDAINW